MLECLRAPRTTGVEEPAGRDDAGEVFEAPSFFWGLLKRRFRNCWLFIVRVRGCGEVGSWSRCAHRVWMLMPRVRLVKVIVWSELHGRS